MKKDNFTARAEKIGEIGGKVGGFKRKQKSLFLVNFVKMIEMLEFSEIRFTSNLAKKLIASFNNGCSVDNNLLIENFATKGNKLKQKDLDEIVQGFYETHRELYEEQWEQAKQQIDAEAEELKRKLIEELKSR
ncbi:hypothetical protein [Stutzerimonas zhaodongensis]|uniref:hypothetical protein n=1 Tax=Stutzerimonas zhaodongensis TaxID=1176257 RepID=UPI001F4E1B55|nr:hypothetical protein [Stutzerimonas zhaodongensis]UNG20190.1 hypothetical protein MKP10_08180 [Stutzerimonas zhaodongensis]